MAQKGNYQLLIEKLDQFIRKYYINQAIRGTLYFIGLSLLLFLTMNLLEHYFFFGKGVRKTLFFSFIGISATSLVVWVMMPLLHYFRLGKVISHEQAARIIGDHFYNVKDKLLNILQLKQQADSQGANTDLILAGIDQKSKDIRPVPFKKAIDLSQNRKYLKYALPPLLLLLIILWSAPSVIKDSTTRIINNNEDFEKPAPFHFMVEEEDLSVVQYNSFPLTVEVDGEVLPDQVFIEVDNYQYQLTKVDANTFTYQFNNVQEDVDFKLSSGVVESGSFTLEVLPKPNIMGFEVELDYPDYLKRKDEILSSIGDLVVPVGTNIDWIFEADHTDDISIQFSGDAETESAKRFSDILFSFKRRAMKNELYKLFVSNEALPKADSVSYSINIIPDQYPTISAEKFQDSVNSKLIYFVGQASDDYGLRSLGFYYRLKKADGEEGELNTVALKKPVTKEVQYSYTWDLEELELEPGDEVIYYFQVSDNDGVNGSKSSRTNLMVFAMPTVEEYEAMAEENSEEIKDRLQKALEESQDVKKEMRELREKMLQEKEFDWQQKKELEKLMERHQELQKEIQEAKDAFEENLKNQQEFTETEENIQEKQEQLEKLFEEMDEEMQELMKKIEELMQEMERDDAIENLEDFELSDEELEMELDRMLELFKQLELEMEWEKTIEDLEELADKQEELSEETKEGETPQEELEERQEEINEEFEEIQEKMEEMNEKNDELEKPKDLGEHEEEMEDIEQDLNESQENLQEQQNQKASGKQKSASQKMRQMAQSMSMQMQSQAMEQMEEDMESLRQLLENLVGLSFDQEDLIDQFGLVNVNTPRYVDLVQEQFKLEDDFGLIEDSLVALSKRVFQIESFVTDKIFEIKSNMKEATDQLEERRKPQASNNQQRVMKNVNDLALMLSEVMNQMQQQMAGMMAGSQMCNKPGGSGGQNGKVPQDKISQGQQKLNEQMQQMKKGMQEGKGGTSEEFAKMAARQAALRQALRNKQKEMQQKGQGSKELQEMIDQMNKVETDLVNKKLTNEMLKRQEEILTRLLEHEKAEREREYDNKRKSEIAKEYDRELPPSLEEYIKKREAEIEMYKTVSPSLKPYYRFLVEEYFKSLKG